MTGLNKLVVEKRGESQAQRLDDFGQSHALIHGELCFSIIP